VTELAYKFTRPGGRSPFTGFAWPVGEWIEVEGKLELCRNGIHACRAVALARWIDDELWLVELEGVEVEQDGLLLARRGRLLSRIEGWDAETSLELARSCVDRVQELAERNPDPLVRRRADHIAQIAESQDPSATALTMYTTAHTYDDAEGTYYEERSRQADWLRDRLQLDEVGLRTA
jgi:hypothetical protein